MLPDPALRPAYDQAVWLYVYRDFSENKADRAAERICLRLGMTSYPQHLLIHPETLARLGDTGRQVDSFLAAMRQAKVEKAATTDAADRTVAADQRAVALERNPSVAAARKSVDDPDIVVRFRALAILAARAPEVVAARAEELLEVPNDPFRYEVCHALAEAYAPRAKSDSVPAPNAIRALEAVVVQPKESLNPNRLRCEAVSALARCGDADTIPVLVPFAAGGWRNGLTSCTIDAIAAIANRDPKAKPAARAALAAAFPAPAADPGEAKQVEALARHVHEALTLITRKKVAFPYRYDLQARQALSEAW